MKLLGIQVVPEGWRWPRVVTHVLDNESKTETLGFLVFIVGAVRALRNPAAANSAEEFLWCVVISSILVGSKMVAKSMLEAMQMKLTGAKPQEVKPNAPAA